MGDATIDDVALAASALHALGSRHHGHTLLTLRAIPDERDSPQTTARSFRVGRRAERALMSQPGFGSSTTTGIRRAVLSW